MKKIVLTMALAIGTLGFIACSDDDENSGKSCADLAQDIEAASMAYFEEQTTENCEAYKAALQAYVDKGCEGSENFETVLEGLTCE